MTVSACPACGGTAFRTVPVLWPELVAEWGLRPDEAAYIDRQQGHVCGGCGCNLRSMALARAVARCFGHPGPLNTFLATAAARRLRVLEVNAAGGLHPLLAALPKHVLGAYPDVDMQRLPYPDGGFDLVVHSDTLEHVPDPVAGLAECRRVLRPGGFCCYTVPIVVGRLTTDRTGKPDSFHGNPTCGDPGYVVRTEYGADAWADVVRAGFAECRIVSVEYPTAQALVGVV